MIAVLSGCVLRCLSRQLAEAFSSPSWNQRKNGAFDSSRVLVKGFDQIRFSRARRAQKPSKSRSASATSLRYASMPEMLACLTNAGDGGKTRFSFSTVSMFEDIPLLLDSHTILAHDDDQEGGPDPERRRRAAVHFLLPPRRLHPRPRASVRP